MVPLQYETLSEGIGDERQGEYVRAGEALSYLEQADEKVKAKSEERV